MSGVATEKPIERAGRAPIEAAPVPAKAVLFGSNAREDADAGGERATAPGQRTRDIRRRDVRYKARGYGINSNKRRSA